MFGIGKLISAMKSIAEEGHALAATMREIRLGLRKVAGLKEDPAALPPARRKKGDAAANGKE